MITGNEPAFPCPSPIHGEPFFGLTKREYFASMIMQGLMSNHQRSIIMTNDDLAELSLWCADALIKQLNK